MDLYHVSEKQYGWIFAFISLGLIICSQLNTWLLRRFTSEKITFVALTTQVILSLVLLGGTYFNGLGLYSTIGLVWLILGTQGFAFPNTAALSLSSFGGQAGTASALMGAAQLGIGAVATALVGFLSNGTAVPMAGLIAVCASGGLTMLIAGGARIRKYEKESSLRIKKRNTDAYLQIH